MKLVIAFVIFTNFLFANTKKITLDEAINIALENNKQNKISKLGLQIAQAQYKQALSANYPTINAMIVGQRVKEDRLFKMRGDITLPSSTAKSLTMATLLSQGLDLTTAQATLNAMPASTFENSTLAIDTDAPAYGRDTVKGSINLQYPIYSGGKITAIIDQAKLNKLLALNSTKREESNVIYDTKKYFYGYVLTKQLLDIALNTLDRMKYVEDLTKTFFETGESLNVKRTDYLSVQVTVALIESMVSKLQANETLVKSALVNSLGLPYNSDIDVVYTEKLMPVDYTLDTLVKQAYKTNSDISKMDIALKISDKKIDEKQAGHYPTLGFLAEVSRTYNSYEFGILNEDQENDWQVGFAANLPLFDGFKTTNSVLEQKVEKKKMYLLKDMVKEGIALQIKSELTNALISYKQIQTLQKARKVAKENRKLNIRGYQIDAIEPEEVVQAQYIEAYVKADYLKYVHDYMVSLAKIDKLVGKELK